MSASKHVARATTPRRLPKRPTTTRFDERLQCVIELAADFYWEQDANGRFTSVEDLLAVPGIGDTMLEALRDLVTV